MDDFGNTIERPIDSRYNRLPDKEFIVDIGLQEKLIGIRVQLSDWANGSLRQSKIWFKIAKCRVTGKGTDYKLIEDKNKEIQEKILEEKKLIKEDTLKNLMNSDWQTKSHVWYIE